MTKLKSRLIKKLRGKTVNQGIRICIDCGSILTFVKETKIRCRECGATRKINKK